MVVVAGIEIIAGSIAAFIEIIQPRPQGLCQLQRVNQVLKIWYYIY
jgi:hypothetical protein